MQPMDALASSQHGLISRAQLRDLGVDRWRLRRWLDSGRLRVVHTNVFATAGAPESAQQRVLACVLETGSGACTSHTTAAWLWGLRGFEPTPIHVVVNRHSRHHERLPWQVHQFTGLPIDHCMTMEGIPVTSPPLTMLHLAQVVGKARLRRAIDDAWSRRILSGEDLFALDNQLARKGRNGIVALREAAEERGRDWVPPESNLESRFMALVDPVGVHGFERQVPINGERWTARVDFLHRRSKTVIEIQSERYHAALTDREADALRRKRLESLGYTVLEVWDNELFLHGDRVRDRILTAITRAA